jgi:hypothetical protein
VGSKIFPVHFAAERCDSLLHLALESQILHLQNAVGSQILPLYDAAGSQILPLYDTAGNQILHLYDAAGSQISPLHDAAGSQIYCRMMQLGVNLASGGQVKTFERIPWPLKGKSGKKSHMGDLHYPIPMRIMY